MKTFKAITLLLSIGFITCNSTCGTLPESKRGNHNQRARPQHELDDDYRDRQNRMIGIPPLTPSSSGRK